MTPNVIKKLEEFEDQWIALSPDESKIVSNNKDLEKAVFQAEKKGVKNPVMVKAPSRNSAYLL